MKYAKKFKLVPYSTETPGVSQVTTTFNNALTSNTFPDEKVKIYNQALSKIKELNPTDTNEKKYDEYEENNEDPNEKAEDRKKRIAKEIAELEKITSEQTASKTVKDYSNSDFFKTKKFKEKSKFDNEKFMKILKDISEDVVLSFGRLATMEKHLHRLAEGKASEVINTAIQTDKPSLNSLSIQTDKPPKKINQATATAYDYNIQELNENDEDFIERRLKDFLIKNPKVNESLNQSKISPNLVQKTPKTLNLDLKTPKAPASMKTKIDPEYQSPKRSRLIDITPLNNVVNPVTIPFYGFNEKINEDENNDQLNFTDLDLTQPLINDTSRKARERKKIIKNRVKEENRKLTREKKEAREKRRQEEKEEKAKQEEEEKAAEAAEKLRIEEEEKAKKPKRRVNNPHPTSNIIPTTRRNNNSTNKNKNFAL